MRHRRLIEARQGERGPAELDQHLLPAGGEAVQIVPRRLQQGIAGEGGGGLLPIASATALAEHLEPRADVERVGEAAAVARRLRGTEIPAFQDTYGWIAYQQGDFDEALSYLEPAAQGLPGNALVQYHLGMTYVALDRAEDAQTQLTRALEIAGPATTLPQMERARETLQTLQSN